MANITYSGIKYPGAVMDILQHKVLGPAFEKYAKRSSIEDNVAFLKAKYDPKRNYGIFFKPGAKYRLNLHFDTLQEAEKLGKAGDWKNKAWKTIHEDAGDECLAMLQGTNVTNFYGADIQRASVEFKAIHLANLRKKVKVNSKAAALLGLDDTAALSEIAAQLQMQDYQEVDKLTTKLLAKAKPKGNKKPDKKSFLAQMKKLFGK